MDTVYTTLFVKPKEVSVNLISKPSFSCYVAPNASQVQVSLSSDKASTNPPVTPEGGPLRNVSFVVSGQNAPGSLDEYDAKLRFRQLARTTPIQGLYIVPDVSVPASTTTQASAVPVVVVLGPASSTVESVTSTSGPVVGVLVGNETTTVTAVVVPVVVAETTTTTLIPLVSYVQFLHLKRVVGPLDEATLKQLIAAAWAAQNNQSAGDINVRVLSNQPVVDDKGMLGSNVTYEITGPGQMAPPNATTEQNTLDQSGFTVCQNCFATPVHSFYMTSEGDNKTVDPMALRESIRQAVILANPSVPPNMIQSAFPQNTPPALSEDVDKNGQDLLGVSYFAVASGDGSGQQLVQVQEPTLAQLQSQLPGQTVYPANSPWVVRPIRLLIQNNGSWTDGTAQPLDNSTVQQVQSAVDSAIQAAAQAHSLNCSGSQALKSKNLYGLFGRQYTQLLFNINSPNDTCTQLPAAVIDEIAHTAQADLNKTSSPDQASLTTSPKSSDQTDPDRVYFHDYVGRLNIFDLQRRKAELTTDWLQANPNCVQTDCAYSPQILATQRRLSTMDG